MSSASVGRPTLEVNKSRIAREPGNLDLSDAKLERMALHVLHDARGQANLDGSRAKPSRSRSVDVLMPNATVRHEAGLGRG